MPRRRARSQTPRELTKKVDGELEAILLKALAHDPKERYSSAGALAQDIENYLTGEPLLARQRSTLYFLRKRIWKHRLGVAIGCSVVALLICIAVFAYIRIAQERNKAVAAHHEARKEADKANAVYAFLEDVFSSVESQEAQAAEITLREALDQAAENVSTKFANQPEVEAKIRTRMGDIYSALGKHEEAEAQYVRALEIRRDVLGEEHADTLQSRCNLARILGQQGKIGEAGAMWSRVLKSCERVLGEEHSLTLHVMNNLADILLNGKTWLDELDRLSNRPLERLRAMHNMEGPIWEGDVRERVKALYRRGFDIRRRTRGPEHPDTIRAMNKLAIVLRDGGELDEAEGLVRQFLEIQLRAFDEKFGDKQPPSVTSPWEAESTETASCWPTMTSTAGSP